MKEKQTGVTEMMKTKVDRNKRWLIDLLTRKGCTSSMSLVAALRDLARLGSVEKEKFILTTLDIKKVKAG